MFVEDGGEDGRKGGGEDGFDDIWCWLVWL